jgi:hypothetical protein
MRIRTDRPCRKPLLWRHWTAAGAVTALVLLFLLPGHALLYALGAGGTAVSLLPALLVGIPGFSLPYCAAMLVAAVILVALAFTIAIMGNVRAESPPAGYERPVILLQHTTDAVGLRWLNIGLLVIGPLLVLTCLLAGRPFLSLACLALTVAVLALLGADYRPGRAAEETPVAGADAAEITLPLHPDATTEFRFAWSFRSLADPGGAGRPLSFTLSLARPRYERTVAVPHDLADASGLGEFMTRDTNPELSWIASEISKLLAAVVGHCTPMEQKCNLLDFVRQYRLVTDLDTKGRKDYLRLPTEVIWETEGTPRCLILTAAALMRQLGFRYTLVRAAPLGGPERLFLALPGFECIGDPGEFYTDPETSEVCALAEPRCAAAPAAALAPTTDWSWYVGPIPEDLATASLARIAVPH